MIFFVTNQNFPQSVMPCENAKKRSHENWHLRTCTEKEFNKRFSEREGLWRSRGSLHSVTRDGYIIRREKDSFDWSIDISDINELVNFAKKNIEISIFYDEKIKSFRINIV